MEEKYTQDILEMVERLFQENNALKLYEVKRILELLSDSSYDINALIKMRLLCQVVRPRDTLVEDSSSVLNITEKALWN